MNHEDFLKFIRRLLGKVPHMGARENLANLIRSRGFEMYLDWDWIPKESLNPKGLPNPLTEIDGIVLEMTHCNSEGIGIYVPKEARK